MSDPLPDGDFFPVVYDELRRLALAQLADERAGHTLDATALVHEAYLRLGDSAFADRRVLIDNPDTLLDIDSALSRLSEEAKLSQAIR